MKISSLARKYAQALFQGLDKNLHEKALVELKEFLAVYLSNKELQDALLSPVFGRNDKRDVIEALEVSSTPGPSVVENLLFVLVNNNRFSVIEEVVACFEELSLAHRGVTSLTVETARELSDGQKKAFNVRLATVYNRTLQVSYRKTDSLIGGFRIWEGDLLYDASVSSQLKQLRTTLLV
jgi:F-type H+-transporting ATPase subunit delta